MTEPRTAIKESCAEVEKKVSEAGLEIAKDTVLHDGQFSAEMVTFLLPLNGLFPGAT